MVEKITAWLKGTRDYGTGVALYVAYGSDRKLKHALLQGKNPFNEKRLHAELSALAGDSYQEKPVVHFTANPILQDVAAKLTPPPLKIAAPSAGLLAAVQTEAHNTWKELMNKRAMLFALCQTDGWEDENDPGKVSIRGRIALDILQYHEKVVVPAYDKLDHVRSTGKLPQVTNVNEVAEQDYELLPDHLVKQTIDNLRKNLGKIRKREQTPERIALIEKHEASLQKLLKRWAYLK